VHVTVKWLETEKGRGRLPTAEAAIGRLAQEWKSNGPVKHPFEPYYRGLADGMVASVLDAMTTESAEYAQEEWAVALGGSTVTVMPDRVLRAASGSVTVQRIRTGKQTKSELTKPIYALLRAGAAARHPGKPIQAEAFYISSGERVRIDGGDDEKRLKEYRDAIEGIEGGDFTPTPTRKCPNCPAYFACGA
jgi:hypothetical protein